MPFVTRNLMLTVTLLSAAAVLLLGGFVWSGVYNIGADDPHTRPMRMMMQTLRARSIHSRSKDLVVPDLTDPQRILTGAGHYAAMCTGCHLAPGMEDSEIRPGLYPQPPNLSKVRIDPKDAFWVVKHGIKMSAMPAWGWSHDDRTIWSMVAFLQKLPNLTPAQYKDIVSRAPPDEDMEGMVMPSVADEGDGHSHAHAASAGTQSHEGAVSKDADAKSTPPMEGLHAKMVPAAEATAEAFHLALQKGDRNAVLALLAPEVTISEGGQTQSRDEYASGHLGEDFAFLKAARIKPISLASMPMGDTAMVGSESEVHATHDGIAKSMVSSEMLTLKQTSSGWKIVKVEWTSRPGKEN